MKKVMLLFALVTTLFACEEKDRDEDNEPTVRPDAIEIVTGLYTRYFQGEPLDTLGNPNTRTENIYFFPNPAKDRISVASDKNIKKLWIVPVQINSSFKNEDFTSLFRNFQYSQSDITAKSKKEVPLATPSSFFALDISSLPTGYHKIFYLLENDSIRWDNLYIYQEATFEQAYPKLMEEWE